ncbi:MAG: hypothetical protein M0Z95_11910 [Actinomycetota bacterium]|jgi:hypothetical protein|nr:hypothetical protein [Actinomycetota bacterium]
MARMYGTIFVDRDVVPEVVIGKKDRDKPGDHVFIMLGPAAIVVSPLQAIEIRRLLGKTDFFYLPDGSPLEA